MSQLNYMALEGVGDCERTIVQVRFQFRPYFHYLDTAIKAVKSGSLVLAWRIPTRAERAALDGRLRDRLRQRQEAAKGSRKRRDKHVYELPKGTWIMLEPPPWRLDEPEETFEAFLEAKDVCDERPTRRNVPGIQRIDWDFESSALMLERAPQLVEPSEDSEAAPTRDRPHGPLIWLAPNTYVLERQKYAVRDLENSPAPRHSALIGLATRSKKWDAVERRDLPESEWAILRRDPRGELRDGSLEQRRFVEVALGTPDFALLEGPPGSGKTTAICELIIQLARAGKRVMLVASTHVAVDNVLERLVEWQDAAASEDKPILPVRIGKQDSISSEALLAWTFERQLQTWKGEVLDALDVPREAGGAGDPARSILREALEAQGDSALARLILDSANLVCGTTIGILQHPDIKSARKQQAGFDPFDVMILDEASKTTFTEFLVPAMYARRWMIIGDVRQLSPFVSDDDLAENLRGLIDEDLARATIHAVEASAGRGGAQVRSVVAVDSEVEADRFATEAKARGVDFVDLDHVTPKTLRGVPGCVPELLFADLIIGSPNALRDYEHRLPRDVKATAGPMPSLPDWEAARRVYLHHNREESLDWSAAVAWRLVRHYELRQNPAESERYEQDLQGLLPESLGEAKEELRRKFDNIRRVALPSILELVQRGFGRLRDQRDDLPLTSGLPRWVLEPRMVSLSYQHRMHPEISAFPRERFYSTTEGNQQLLRDASGVAGRSWGYTRHASRAEWADVQGKKENGNRNSREVRVALDELRAFAAWAALNPKPGGEAWTVALLTFYRGQEKLLRDELQRLTEDRGRSRNFKLPNVQITLCTVDRFQGHEADLVLLSFVKTGRPKSSVGFLNSPNRLNVALTRARHQIVLIGDKHFFAECRSPLLQQLANSDRYTASQTWETNR